MCKMIATGRFGAKKENGRPVLVNPQEVVDLHQDGNPIFSTFHVVRGKQRGATFQLPNNDPRIAKLDRLDDAL